MVVYFPIQVLQDQRQIILKGLRPNDKKTEWTRNINDVSGDRKQRGKCGDLYEICLQSKMTVKSETDSKIGRKSV